MAPCSSRFPQFLEGQIVSLGLGPLQFQSVAHAGELEVVQSVG